MAAKWKEPPRDALDTLTLGAVDLRSLDSIEQLDYMPFDPVLKRTEGVCCLLSRYIPYSLIILCKSLFLSLLYSFFNSDVLYCFDCFSDVT